MPYPLSIVKGVSEFSLSLGKSALPSMMRGISYTQLFSGHLSLKLEASGTTPFAFSFSQAARNSSQVLGTSVMPASANAFLLYTIPEVELPVVMP
ncbi:hypothetical protein D3C86_1639200 [compost metagenome]